MTKNSTAIADHCVDVTPYFHAGEPISRKVRDIYASEALKRLIEDRDLQDYTHIVAGRMVGKGFKTVCTTTEHTKMYEDKVWIRETMGELLPFPPFRIFNVADDSKVVQFDTLKQELCANSLVLQNHKLSGSRGTFIAHNQNQFEVAVRRIAELGDPGDKMVVSKYLENAQERSLQVCIAGEEIYVGPAQAQLVRHPLLVSESSDGVLFCGGRIDASLMDEKTYGKASVIAKKIGAQLRSEGYKGIFGVDFMVTGEELYMIEINPRTTGLSPLLGSLQPSMPYNLLHLLELTGSHYTINSNAPEPTATGSFLQIFSLGDCIVEFDTGVYDAQGRRLLDGFENGLLIPDDYDHYFVALRVSAGEIVEDGKAMAYIYSRKQLFDDAGNIEAGAAHLIGLLRANSHHATA